MCHILVELEHNAFYTIKKLNLDLKIVDEKRLLQLNEIDELRLDAYENAKIYKEKTKRWHDHKIVKRHFEPGQHVLSFNLCLKLFSGKLKSRWLGPFIISNVVPHETMEIIDELTNETFKVNGQRLKHYWGGDIDCQRLSINLFNPK
ncbi:PREDICTED: uncharacterized protein LOC108663241 [Theobroma cacao]|uniref:Uncharacterized protein LOC108663241 n=1 Tax=Theobroma cacao TaxID=3641 RepID=A0AB32WUI1_THECC|nr:PREDICTED: uncharacterized protein LOC108663241 [Theobroma cacao]